METNTDTVPREFTQTAALPLVSVIIPSYNHARFLKECIKSIFEQTYQRFELVVVDDGSSDNSVIVLEDLQKIFPFALHVQKNLGITRTLNRAIRELTAGDLIAICASDDYWHPEKLEKQVLFLAENPDVAMCFGKNHFVNDLSEIVPNYCRDYHLLKGGWIFNDLFLFRFHPHVNYMIRREVYELVGYYDENSITEDYDMNLKISAKFPIGFIDDFLGYYRIPSSAMKLKRYEQLTASHVTIIRNYRSHPLYRSALRHAWLRNFDTYSGFRGYKVKALFYMLKAFPLFHAGRFLAALVKLFLFWKHPGS